MQALCELEGREVPPIRNNLILVYWRRLDKHLSKKIQMLSNRRCNNGVQSRLSALSMIVIDCGPKLGPRPLTAELKTGHGRQKAWV